MFGSQILDVAIGLVFVYLLLSLICSTLMEWVARVFALRANTLEKAIRHILADDGGSSQEAGNKIRVRNLIG